MSLARLAVLSLVAVAACSGSHPAPRAVADGEWSHAYAGSPDGWWINWQQSLGGKAPYGAGTRFETEKLGPHGIRETETFEVLSIEAQPGGEFKLMLRSSINGSTYPATIPRRLAYVHSGNRGTISARNEKFVSVTVPAGTFDAGRLWTSESSGYIPYERDEWVVPELPIPVQSWYRKVNATDPYDPPADGALPEGTELTRLVRIDRKPA